MKAGRYALVTIVLAAVLFVVLAAHGQPFSLYTASNLAPTNLFLTRSPENTTNPVLPVIEMVNIPLSRGISNLERQAGLHYAVDERLTDWWGMTNGEGRRAHEPLVSFRWTNLTARAALFRLLDQHELYVDEDPFSLACRITYKGDVVGPADAFVPAEITNLIPLIEFQDVPITVALENLARQGHINYMLDPEIGYGGTDENGNIIHEPTISHKWTNTTCGEAFADVCEQYYFVGIRDPRTGVTLIRYRNHGVNFVKPDFYANDTNDIPVIKFEDVPLSLALENLAEQSGMKYIS